MAFLKRLIFILGVLILGVAVNQAKAQSDARTHFIYIQSENQQPYYVILNNKSYSSSSVGYLIISKLKDGDYNITVGFPQDVFPAQTYALKIKGTDAGFNLQKASGKQWELIDKLSQKSLAVVNTDAPVEASNVASTNTDNEKNGSAFGALLSKTSNDTTNYKAYAQQAVKEDVAPKAAAVDNSAEPAATETATTPRVKIRGRSEQKLSETLLEKEKAADSSKDEYNNETYESAAARSATQSIVKISERDDRRGITMAFVETYGDRTDTITTFFPGDSKNSILDDDDANSVSVSPEKAALKKEVDNRKSARNNPFYKGDATAANKNDKLGLFAEDSEENKTSNTAKEEETSKQASSSKEIFNSTCNSMLSDKDVEKIRKKMIAKSTDEEMISVARKYIDTKCVYTSQVKDLGGLLISDNGRFALYRILYPNVYDGGQFKSLEDQLLDKNYKSQFESLIGNR